MGTATNDAQKTAAEQAGVPLFGPKELRTSFYIPAENADFFAVPYDARGFSDADRRELRRELVLRLIDRMPAAEAISETERVLAYLYPEDHAASAAQA